MCVFDVQVSSLFIRFLFSFLSTGGFRLLCLLLPETLPAIAMGCFNGRLGSYTRT